jgi:hypothetical protein
MAKGKKVGRGQSASKKSSGKGEWESKSAEYVSCLLELHKLQGALLSQLEKEVCEM